MKKYIVANWKMHGIPDSVKSWAAEFVRGFKDNCKNAEVAVCPPDALLPFFKEAVAGANISLGGQDCHAEGQGAYTGETSAVLLKAVGCRYVIVGHSERRAYAGESDEIVRDKAARAIDSGLVPIICIGETLAQREEGKTAAVISAQIEGSLPANAVACNFVIAYEPVWAIGTGKVPTLLEIAEAHKAIIALVSVKTGVDIEKISVLYGGSVKPDNAGEILHLPEVAGVLVGGASLNARDFLNICVGCTDN